MNNFFTYKIFKRFLIFTQIRILYFVYNPYFIFVLEENGWIYYEIKLTFEIIQYMLYLYIELMDFENNKSIMEFFETIEESDFHLFPYICLYKLYFILMKKCIILLWLYTDTKNTINGKNKKKLTINWNFFRI